MLVRRDFRDWTAQLSFATPVAQPLRDDARRSGWRAQSCRQDVEADAGFAPAPRPFVATPGGRCD